MSNRKYVDLGRLSWGCLGWPAGRPAAPLFRTLTTHSWGKGSSFTWLGIAFPNQNAIPWKGVSVHVFVQLRCAGGSWPTRAHPFSRYRKAQDYRSLWGSAVAARHAASAGGTPAACLASRTFVALRKTQDCHCFLPAVSDPHEACAGGTPAACLRARAPFTGHTKLKRLRFDAHKRNARVSLWPL